MRGRTEGRETEIEGNKLDLMKHKRRKWLTFIQLKEWLCSSSISSFPLLVMSFVNGRVTAWKSVYCSSIFTIKSSGNWFNVARNPWNKKWDGRLKNVWNLLCLFNIHLLVLTLWKLASLNCPLSCLFFFPHMLLNFSHLTMKKSPAAQFCNQHWEGAWDRRNLTYTLTIISFSFCNFLKKYMEIPLRVLAHCLISKTHG